MNASELNEQVMEDASKIDAETIQSTHEKALNDIDELHRIIKDILSKDALTANIPVHNQRTRAELFALIATMSGSITNSSIMLQKRIVMWKRADDDETYGHILHTTSHTQLIAVVMEKICGLASTLAEKPFLSAEHVVSIAIRDTKNQVFARTQELLARSADGKK